MARPPDRDETRRRTLRVRVTTGEAEALDRLVQLTGARSLSEAIRAVAEAADQPGVREALAGVARQPEAEQAEEGQR